MKCSCRRVSIPALFSANKPAVPTSHPAVSLQPPGVSFMVSKTFLNRARPVRGLYPRTILPVQLLQAASAGSNYYVSVPVKEIWFASVTLSSSPAYQLGRSSNVGLISVKREEVRMALRGGNNLLSELYITLENLWLSPLSNLIIKLIYSVNQ